MTVTTARSRNKGPRVFVCLACDLLAESTRSDAITCSPRCRVWLHRNPERLDRLRRICEGLKVTPGMVQESSAIGRLRPDLGERIGAGELGNEDVRKDVHREFMRLVIAEARQRLQDEAA